MEIEISLKGGALEGWARAFREMPTKAKREFENGLSDGGLKLRTQVRLALRAQMSTRTAAPINQRTPSKLDRSGLTFTIYGVGKGLPINAFPVRMSRSKRAMVRWSPRQHWRLQPRDAAGRFGKIEDTPDAAVSAMVWGSLHAFQRSFVGPRGPRAIRGGEKGRVRQLYGPAVSKELNRDQSLAAFQRGIAEIIEPSIARRLAALLPGR
ncbi:hypothetical protein [Kaistia sp. MMO-174]|uniref:hypothetical protein n=1 Tax=Kaistia sp. MMO-174 TaxID=3081256 RepID=UPI0030186EA4